MDPRKEGTLSPPRARPESRDRAESFPGETSDERIGIHAALGLALHHDRGNACPPFQHEIRFLGIALSPAFVREHEGDGCAERFNRILKEPLLRVRSSRTIEEVRLALQEFRDRTKSQWIVQTHGYLAPSRAGAKLFASVEVAA